MGLGSTGLVVLTRGKNEGHRVQPDWGKQIRVQPTWHYKNHRLWKIIGKNAAGKYWAESHYTIPLMASQDIKCSWRWYNEMTCEKTNQGLAWQEWWVHKQNVAHIAQKMTMHRKSWFKGLVVGIQVSWDSVRTQKKRRPWAEEEDIMEKRGLQDGVDGDSCSSIRISIYASNKE